MECPITHLPSKRHRQTYRRQSVYSLSVHRRQASRRTPPHPQLPLPTPRGSIPSTRYTPCAIGRANFVRWEFWQTTARRFSFFFAYFLFLPAFLTFYDHLFIQVEIAKQNTNSIEASKATKHLPTNLQILTFGALQKLSKTPLNLINNIPPRLDFGHF